jgi:hypothetical protein
LPHYCGKARDTGGAGRHGAGFELVVGDGGALHIAGKEPMLALDGVPMLSSPVLRRRHLFDGSDDQALVGLAD